MQKPELIVKRANDIVNLGTGTGEKEKRIALELLHGAISNKKRGVWSKAYEGLMRRHVELSVDLKDHTTAKDGMHQYRNLCVNADPSSLESNILYLIELGERKLGDAKRRSNQASFAASALSADLEQEESPESLVLSSMTEDGTNDRTHREMVVPWLKFVWEIYRAAVELLSRIPKLDKTYHDISRRAFQFCQDNNRRTEFRRLCEMLRIQLENLQKPQSTILKSAKPQFEWSPEVVELFMQTKFEQLDKATAMDLWNEAFRTIEDISKILSKKSAKTKSLSTYYEKLTKIFWVADNKLFHAYALLKLFSLTTLKGDEKQYLASAVLLAAMSVPPTATTATATAAASLSLTDERDADEYQVDRNAELAALLDFHSVNPTRQSLMQEITQRAVAPAAHPELAELFTAMEIEFSPIKLSKKIGPAIAVLRTLAQTPASATTTVSLQQYAAPLERNVVVRYMQQLSKAYSQVKIDYVMKALSGLTVLSRMQIERVLVDAVRSRHLSLRVSHVEGSITFLNTAASLQAVDTQVYHLGQVLSRAHETVRHVMHSVTDEDRAQRIANRRQFFRVVEHSYDELYTDLMERARVIEQMKEDYEQLLLRKEEEKLRAEQEEVERIEREKKMAEERKRREEEEEKKRKEQEEAETVRIFVELRRLGYPRELSELQAMTIDERKTVLKEAEEAYRKSKEEEKKRLESQAKSFDYRVRAERLESFVAVDRCRDTWAEEDNKLREVATAAMSVRWAEEHSKQLVEKQRLAKFAPFRAAFESSFRAQQLDFYEQVRERETQAQLKRLRDANLAAARRVAAEEKEKRAEENRRRAIEEEERRLEVMRAEVARVEREKREQQEAEERRRREVEEAEAAAAAAAAAKEAQASTPPPPAPAAGRYQPPSRNPPPASEETGGRWRPSGGGTDRDGGDTWRQQPTRGAGGGSGFGRNDRDRDTRDRDTRDRRDNNNDRDRERGGGDRFTRGGDRDRERDRPAPRRNDRPNTTSEGSWR